MWHKDTKIDGVVRSRGWLTMLKLYLETTVFNWYFERTRPGYLDAMTLFEAMRDGYFDRHTSTRVSGSVH